MNRFCTRAIAPLIGLTLSACAASASNFACSGHEFSNTMPSIEGRDGFFFRTFADLRMQHPLTDQVADQLQRLSRELAAGGTTLIYVTIPSKSQAMPDYLPPRSAEYSYDVNSAGAVYQDIIARLRSRGVAAPDIQTALQGAGADNPPFFRADFHWTPEGARLAAEEIAKTIVADPNYANTTPKNFETIERGREVAFSGMRRALQVFCRDELPPVATMSFLTREVAAQTDGDSQSLDIFGSDQAAPQAVLVGTSFSDSDINNFAGFLSEYSGLNIVNYAITGGNQFGAITSYLTSTEFAESRPQFLIWENPIYNNLAQYGPGHIEELIAAASGRCDQPLVTTSDGGTTLRAELADIRLRPEDVIFANLGQDGARRAEFSFVQSSGVRRRAVMQRGDRLRATGRFYQPLLSLWSDDIAEVQVTFDRPVSDVASLSICRTTKDDPS